MTPAGVVAPVEGEALRAFIHPGHTFQLVDGLITTFTTRSSC